MLLRKNVLQGERSYRDGKTSTGVRMTASGPCAVKIHSPSCRYQRRLFFKSWTVT